MMKPAAQAQEALRNLKLDASFFHRIIQQDVAAMEESSDYDLYLMERGIMPLLLQGLEALARHVEKLNRGGGLSGGSTAPFNPLTWLAQYLLRNHPGKVKDHRTPVYDRLAEMASVERGRRSLLRRRDEMEEEWRDMGREGPIAPADVPRYLQRLDTRWGLDGAFSRKLPTDFAGLLPGGGELVFVDFWVWFEAYVADKDILRANAFEEAILRHEEDERLAQEEQEEQARRERAVQKVLEVRKALEDEFASLCADLYTNDGITQIINKGGTIHGVVQQEGGPPLIGVHIELILSMLRLWGCPAEGAEDSWGEEAMVAWQQWVDTHGPPGAQPMVDSVNLRALLDRDAFEAYLEKAFPAEEDLEAVAATPPPPADA